MRRPHLITPRRSLDRRNASVPSTRSCSVLFFFFSKRMIFSRVVELILAHQQLTGRRRRRLSRTSFLLRLLLIAVRWSGRCSSDMTRTRARTSTESGEAAKEIKTVFFLQYHHHHHHHCQSVCYMDGGDVIEGFSSLATPNSQVKVRDAKFQYKSLELRR